MFIMNIYQRIFLVGLIIYFLIGLIVQIIVSQKIVSFMTETYKKYGQEQSIPTLTSWSLVLMSPATYLRAFIWPLSIYQYQLIRNYNLGGQF